MVQARLEIFSESVGEVAICSASSDREVLSQLKVEAAAWVGKANASKLYREFKSIVAAALTAELEIDSIRRYLEISGRENADAGRYRWLKLYAGG